MTDLTKDAYVVVISSDMMGDGEREIGEKLMTSFTYALSEQDQFPTHVLFYNSGVHVSAGESKAREESGKTTRSWCEDSVLWDVPRLLWL